MRRFSHKGSFSRKVREPVMWDRPGAATAVDVSGVYGALIGVTLFDPTTIIAGNQDLRVTLRRLRFYFAHKLLLTAGAAVPQSFAGGVYIGRAGEPLRDPTYAVAADQRTDWMWHVTSPFFPGAAAVTVQTALGANVLNGQDQGDVKANRKLDQDELVIFTAKVFRSDPAGDAAPTTTRQTLVVQVSNLYQRTMRR